MTDTMALARQEDFPTHRLRVLCGKDHTGQTVTKDFFFTAEEANAIAIDLNNQKEPFFVFGKGTPQVQAYPKYGATLDPMTPSEIKQRHQKYFDGLAESRKSNEQKQKDKESKEREDWRKKNSEKFEEILKEAEKMVEEENKDRSFFQGLPKNRKTTIYLNQARILVQKRFFPDHR